MKIAAVITTYNRASQLERCLWSLFEYGRVTPDIACIVDDGSTDHTRAALESLAQKYPVKWMRRERAGGWQSPSIPRNMAIRMTPHRCDMLLFLEPEMLLLKNTLDVLVTRNYVEGGHAFVNASAQGFVNSPFRGDEWCDPDWLFGASQTQREFNQTAVRCALAPRDTVFRIHGYQESFTGWGHDDTSFVERMVRAGCGMKYENNARVIHQWHDPPPMNAETANANLARMGVLLDTGALAEGADDEWGTDSGKHRELLLERASL